MSDDIKVLLVDDEEDFTEMLSLRLETVGMDVRTASSGGECLKEVGTEQPDVIVLDVKMPGMDGIETLRAVKTEYPDVEVIMMTGHGAVESANEGKALGAFGYMIKPADFDELCENLKAAKAKKDAG